MLETYLRMLIRYVEHLDACLFFLTGWAGPYGSWHQGQTTGQCAKILFFTFIVRPVLVLKFIVSCLAPSTSSVSGSRHQCFNINQIQSSKLNFTCAIWCQGLWRRLVSLGPTDDPLSSAEYGTILGRLYIQFDGECRCQTSQLGPSSRMVDCVDRALCFSLIATKWNKLLLFLF